MDGGLTMRCEHDGCLNLATREVENPVTHQRRQYCGFCVSGVVGAWAERGYRARFGDLRVTQLARSGACAHCHDDPPAGHTCPRCGTESASREEVDHG